MTPGKRTLNHWRVGKKHRVSYSDIPGKQGMCVSVTPWGNDRIRWVRLAMDDGTEKSFAPSEVDVVES